MTTLKNNGWFGKGLCIALLVVWPLVTMAQKEKELLNRASLENKESLAKFVAHIL